MLQRMCNTPFTIYLYYTRHVNPTCMKEAETPLQAESKCSTAVTIQLIEVRCIEDGPGRLLPHLILMSLCLSP